MDGWLGVFNDHLKMIVFGSELFTNDIVNLKHQGAGQKLMIGWHKHQGVSETPKNADVICEQSLNKSDNSFFPVNLSYEAVCPNVGNNSCRIQSSLLSTTRWREQGEEDVGPQRRGLNRWQSFPLVLDPLLRPHRHPPHPLSLLGHDLRVLGYVLLALLLQTKIGLRRNVYCITNH